MAHKQYNSISSATIAGTAVTGMKSYSVNENTPHLIDPSDDDLFGQGAIRQAGSVAWSAQTDDPAHGISGGDTGSGGFTEKQGVTTKAVTIANQVVDGVGRNAVDRNGKGGTSINGQAYSADGSTSPVAWPA